MLTRLVDYLAFVMNNFNNIHKELKTELKNEFQSYEDRIKTLQDKFEMLKKENQDKVKRLEDKVKILEKVNANLKKNAQKKEIIKWMPTPITSDDEDDDDDDDDEDDDHMIKGMQTPITSDDEDDDDDSTSQLPVLRMVIDPKLFGFPFENMNGPGIDMFQCNDRPKTY